MFGIQIFRTGPGFDYYVYAGKPGTGSGISQLKTGINYFVIEDFVLLTQTLILFCSNPRGFFYCNVSSKDDFFCTRK